MNFFMEVAKMRAARLLWAKLLTQFNPKDPRSLSLRTHCQTSGWSLTAQDVFNNVMRTTIEAMAATQGHTQSLHTNALDEALALPTDFSARIARNTQLFLQQESGTNRIIDPWGGSYYVERLTRDLAAKAWGHIQEVEALGGMAKAIEAGVPKLRIEEASAKTQARIDAGRQAVIGVNKFKPVNEAAIDVLKVENSTVRRLQIDKLKRLRTERDQKEVDQALAALTRSAGEGNGNLLALAIDAARAKATVGEISDAMEKVFGRHRAEIKSITGVYKREASAMSNRVEKVQELIDAFENAEGRRPRILVAKIGQDGHDRGQKVIASAFADVGFDVDIGPLFATADEAARQAVENDVHILGVSSLAAAHLTAVPELKAALKKHGREDIMIIIGGVVPPQDYDALYKAGAEAIFPPGTVISDAAEELIHKLNARLGHSRRRRSNFPPDQHLPEGSSLRNARIRPDISFSGRHRMRCSARPSPCRRAQAGLFHQDQDRSKPASFSTRRSRPIRRWQRIVWPRARSGRRRTVPMPTRNASRSRSCSATARGPWSGNTRRARWSMAAMSASSGPTMNIPAARIPTVRPTRSCGTGQRANASASVRSSPKPPTTARR